MTTAQAIVIAACIYAATTLGSFGIASLFRVLELRQRKEEAELDREVAQRPVAVSAQMEMKK